MACSLTMKITLCWLHFSIAYSVPESLNSTLQGNCLTSPRHTWRLAASPSERKTQGKHAPRQTLLSIKLNSLILVIYSKSSHFPRVFLFYKFLNNVVFFLFVYFKIPKPVFKTDTKYVHKRFSRQFLFSTSTLVLLA